MNHLPTSPRAAMTSSSSSALAERDLMRLALARPSVSQLFYPSLESEVVTEYMLHRRKHHTDEAWTHLILGMHCSRTLYVGNLGFQTREEQLYEFFSRAGHVRRIIMGLNAQTRTPCGFAFVEFDTHVEAARAQHWFTGLKLDERVVRADLDQEFEEGRQYGRSKSGGQLSDDFRGDFDAARGGWGVAQQARKEQRDRHRKAQLDQFRFGADSEDAQPPPEEEEEIDPTETVDRVRTDARASRPLKLSASTIAALTEGVFPHYALPVDARVLQALQLAQGGVATSAGGTAAAATASGAQLAAPAASSSSIKRVASPAVANGHATSSAAASAAHVSSPPSKRPRQTHNATQSPPRSPVAFAGAAAAASAASSSSPRPFSSGSPVAAHAHAGSRSPQAHGGGARSPALLGAAGAGGGGSSPPWTPPERGYTPEHDDDYDRRDEQAQLSDGDRTPPPPRSPHSPPRRHEGDLGHDDATPPPAVADDQPAGAQSGVGDDSELDDDAHTPRGNEHEDDRGAHGRGRELDDDAATPPPLDADEADQQGDAAMHDDQQPDYAAFER